MPRRTPGPTGCGPPTPPGPGRPRWWPIRTGRPVTEGGFVGGHALGGVAQILEQDARERRGYPVKKVEGDVQRVVADLAHEMGLQVVLPPRRGLRQRLGLGVSPGPYIVGQRRAELPQWPDDPLPLCNGAVVAEQNAARFAPAVGEGRQEGDDVHLVGHIGGKLADQGEEVPYPMVRVDQEAGQHHGADGMQPVLERRYDAEVAAAAPQGPQQVGVLVGAGGERPAVGGDHVGGNQVVATEAVSAGQPLRCRRPA